MAANLVFLPTPSARRATHSCKFLHFCYNISTHALREEGDAHTTDPVDPWL